MKIKSDFAMYFETEFDGQLAGLPLEKPNRVVLEHMVKDDSVRFFGGMDWSNVVNDLDSIPESDRENFIMALFLMSLVDQTMHSHFKSAYPAWRSIHPYPKFGWSGFGPHFENPLKLLWVPEERGIVDVGLVIKAIPDFTGYFKVFAQSCLLTFIPECSVGEFLTKIKSDPDYVGFSQGRIVAALKEALI